MGKWFNRIWRLNMRPAHIELYHANKVWERISPTVPFFQNVSWNTATIYFNLKLKKMEIYQKHLLEANDHKVLGESVCFVITKCWLCIYLCVLYFCIVSYIFCAMFIKYTIHYNKCYFSIVLKLQILLGIM